MQHCKFRNRYFHCNYLFTYAFIQCTVEPLYCGHHWAKKMYQGVLISEVDLYTIGTSETRDSLFQRRPVTTVVYLC